MPRPYEKGAAPRRFQRVVTIGKAIAGGIPIGAYGVSEDVGARIDVLTARAVPWSMSRSAPAPSSRS
jgi:hypothetical protein